MLTSNSMGAARTYQTELVPEPHLAEERMPTHPPNDKRMIAATAEGDRANLF